MTFTVEKGGAPRLTFAEFRDSYTKGQYAPKWRRLLGCFPPRKDFAFNPPRRRWSVEWERLAFELRVLVPNRMGYFGGRESVGRQWCFPWQWHRRYYAVRFPVETP